MIFLFRTCPAKRLGASLAGDGARCYYPTLEGLSPVLWHPRRREGVVLFLQPCHPGPVAGSTFTTLVILTNRSGIGVAHDLAR